MKSVIVITLALAFIYSFEVGGAGTWVATDPKRLMTLTEQKIQNVTSGYKSFLTELASIWKGQKKIVNEIRVAAIAFLQINAVKNNKTRNKKANRCINSARKRLNKASAKFFRPFDKEVEVQLADIEKQINPRLEQGKLIITALDNIIKGINQTQPVKEATAKVFIKYKTLRDKLQQKQKPLSEKYANVIQMAYEYFAKLPQTLLNRVHLIRTAGKKCIIEA